MMETRLHAQLKATPTPSFTRVRGGVLQRKCACSGAAGLATECEECNKQQLSLQRSTDTSQPESPNSAGVPPIVPEVLRSPGQPLDSETRAFMEPRFGHDFSRVRVHSGARAADSARAVNALAYTVGQDVVFGAGQYRPHSSGRELLAHELTHTIQQGNRSEPGMLSVSGVDDASEREAETASQMIDGGRVVRRSTSRQVHIARQPANTDASGGGPNLTAVPTFPETPTDDGKTKSGKSASGPEAKLEGVCLRTPIPPGIVRFNGCSAKQLLDYAVIPEHGTVALAAANGVEYAADGFWYRYHPRGEWFKVGSHCDVDVMCQEEGFSTLSCCNFAASLIKGWPDWSAIPHGPPPNPF